MRARTRYLPIWIGAVEATAIAFALEHMVLSCPLTHDLLAVSEALDHGGIDGVITELRDQGYYADLVFDQDGSRYRSRHGRQTRCAAMRSDAPIFASERSSIKHGIEISRDERGSRRSRGRLLRGRPTEDFDPADRLVSNPGFTAATRAGCQQAGS